MISIASARPAFGAVSVPRTWTSARRRVRGHVWTGPNVWTVPAHFDVGAKRDTKVMKEKHTFTIINKLHTFYKYCDFWDFPNFKHLLEFRRSLWAPKWARGTVQSAVCVGQKWEQRKDGMRMSIRQNRKFWKIMSETLRKHFQGDRCELIATDCRGENAREKCQNGGQCISVGQKAFCICPTE